MPLALASTVTGSGPPAVILHGLFGSGTNWRTIARRLASGFECHLVDQRNHGRSPHARGMAYPALAADVLGYLDANLLDRTGLIGHSMGGKTAMTLALLAPERVRWLVVADIVADRHLTLDRMQSDPLPRSPAMAGYPAPQSRRESPTDNPDDAAFADHRLRSRITASKLVNAERRFSMI